MFMCDEDECSCVIEMFSDFITFAIFITVQIKKIGKQQYAMNNHHPGNA